MSDEQTLTYDYHDYSVVEMDPQELDDFIISFIKETKKHFGTLDGIYLSFTEAQEALKSGKLTLDEKDELHNWLKKNRCP